MGRGWWFVWVREGNVAQTTSLAGLCDKVAIAKSFGLKLELRF